MTSHGLLLVCLTTAAWAQQSSVTTSTPDLNGRREPGAAFSTAKAGDTATFTEYGAGVNGRLIPRETVEERVIREDASGRVVERVIRRFDGDGRPGLAEKQRVEERKNADGSTSSLTQVYRGDLNGGFQLAERVTVEAAKRGDSVTSNVTVDRAGLSGDFETVERVNRTVSGEKDNTKSTATTFRKDASGRFVEALKVTAESKVDNGRIIQNTAQYEPGDNGQLQLASQTVARVVKNADGTESREVDVYRKVPGRVDASGGPPKLEERQVIQTQKQGDKLIETLVVQRPTINDPNRLGAPQKIGERVCSGKCL